jgi:hypothetical protein
MRKSVLYGLLVYSFLLGCNNNPMQPSPVPINDFKVHGYYIVPAGGDYYEENATRVLRAMLETQRWFQVATGGLTFEFLDEIGIYSIYVTDHPIEYYQEDWWGLLLSEMREKGHPVESSGTILMMWVEGLTSISDEAYALGGWSCEGTCGAAILPISSVQAPTLVSPDLGAVFHELGHALQLEHPVEESDLPLNPDEEDVLYSVMCQGNIRAGTSNSDHGFLTTEKSALSKNPFMKEGIELRQDIWTTRIINYPVLGPEPEPIIQFEIVNSTTVKFSSNIENGIYYYWYFGDGSTSFEKEPTHTYRLGAFYNVTLMVTTDDFMAARTNQFVNVN